jgi:cytochrome c peroxidase
MSMNVLRTCGLVVALLTCLPLAHADGFTGALSGSWWNPDRDGEGQFISFQQTGDRRVAILAYFTYDDQGRARWMVGNVDFDDGATTLDIPMISARGARFGNAFDPESVIIDDAGRVALTFVDCNRLEFRYVGGDQELQFELQRLVGPTAGGACDDQTPQDTGRWAGAQTGAWWDPARGGEGQFLAIETLGERRIATLYYFTFDDEGRPSWRVGAADLAPSDTTPEAAVLRIPLVTGAGARFGAAFDPSDVVRKPAGLASLHPIACQQLRMRIEGAVSFGLTLERLGGEPIGLPCPIEAPAPLSTDEALAALIAEHELIGDPSAGRDLPGIDAPLAQLGMQLFFSKRLGAELDVACASCHHPALGGADGLALSIGPGAVNPDLLGPGRQRADGEIRMHRNTPTFFNTGLFDTSLFWDSRVEQLTDENGNDAGIRTPATALGVADPNAGPNLLAAQARFPVGARHEMRGDALPGRSLGEVHSWLAERLGDYGDGAGLLPPSDWLERFRAAFDSEASAEELITFDNVALALGEYQRSAVFVETPWSHYVRGDLDAIDLEAKRGALLFFNTTEDGGMHCALCHSGDRFTNLQPRRIGFPQVGPGFGDGIADDFGRERETGDPADHRAFRVPSLLNISRTAPYGHSGMYNSLGNVLGHYFNPQGTVFSQMFIRSWCDLPPFNTQPDCEAAADLALDNSRAALATMQAERVERPDIAMPQFPTGLSAQENFDAVEAFLETLTDPCLLDRACYGRWIPAPDEAPDALQLNAVDANGDPL